MCVAKKVESARIAPTQGMWRIFFKKFVALRFLPEKLSRIEEHPLQQKLLAQIA
jgi:hypothetical protein